MSGVRAASPTIHHIIYLANDRIHQHKEKDLRAATQSFEKILRKGRGREKERLSEYAEYLQGGARDIDFFVQKQIAENAIQFVVNIPKEEEMAIREVISDKWSNNTQLKKLLEEVDSISPSLMKRLSEIAAFTQQQFDDFIVEAKRKNELMLQKAPKKCGSLSRKLKGKLSTIYNMPQEQRGEEEMQITAQILQSAAGMKWDDIEKSSTLSSSSQEEKEEMEEVPALEKKMKDANDKLLDALSKRIIRIHDLLHEETEEIGEKTEDRQEMDCVYEMDQLLDRFIDSTEAETESLMTIESHQRALEALGRLKSSEASRIRKLLSENDGLKFGNREIEEDVKEIAPTIHVHYMNVVDSVRMKISEVDGAASERLQQMTSEVSSSSSLMASGQQMLTIFSSMNARTEKDLSEFLPRVAIKMLYDQPYSEKESLRQLMFRWLTNDYQMILDEISEGAPELYKIVGPFEKLVKDKKGLLAGDAARLFHETAAESLRKLVLDIAGEPRLSDFFTVKESLRALAPMARQEMIRMVKGLSREEKAIFTFSY